MLAIIGAGLATALPANADKAKLTPAEARGKIIYTTGRDAAGRPFMFRLLSAGPDPMPAVRIYCANCHGADGRGGRQGEILMADIRSETLRRPLRPSPSWNRGRAPYTDALLARAITQGIDSSGHLLTAAMPRWILSKSQMQDLLAYLQRLGGE